MLQNETQQKAHLEIEMKLLQSLAEMRPFSSTPHTKGENHLGEILSWTVSGLILQLKVHKQVQSG